MRFLDYRDEEDVIRAVAFLKRELLTAEAYSHEERRANAAEVRYTDTLVEMMLGKRRILAAEEDDGALAGVAVLWHEPDVSYAGWVVVRADLRGRGLVRGLYPAYLRWLREHGVRSLRAECRVANAPSARLMEFAGFTRMGGPTVSYGGAMAHLYVLDVDAALRRLAEARADQPEA